MSGAADLLSCADALMTVPALVLLLRCHVYCSDWSNKNIADPNWLAGGAQKTYVSTAGFGHLERAPYVYIGAV